MLTEFTSLLLVFYSLCYCHHSALTTYSTIKDCVVKMLTVLYGTALCDSCGYGVIRNLHVYNRQTEITVTGSRSQVC